MISAGTAEIWAIWRRIILTAKLIYHGPLLMSRNARYKVNSVKGNTFDITLTA